MSAFLDYDLIRMLIAAGVLDARGNISAINRYGTRQKVTLSVDTNLALATHSGLDIYVDTDAKVMTLPATHVGDRFRIINDGADAGVLVSIAPNAADKISGMGLTAADNKKLLNTKATAKRGDFVELVADGVDGWVVNAVQGTWAREA